MTKRLRRPKLVPGQLSMYWGREDRYSQPGIMIAYGGDGATKRDSHLIHHYICSEKMSRDYSRGGEIKFDPSLIKELEDRGYDLTTLKFSIQRKKDGNSD